MAHEIDDLRQVVIEPGLSAKLNDLIRFGDLLKNCVVDKAFKVSDEWTRNLRLTPLGESVVREFMAKNKSIKPNDARLAVFLQVGASSGLFVSLATDLDGLRKTLGDEIRRGRMLFPYIFGRDLHDHAADVAPRKTNLNLSESLAVLRKLPVGVFQAGTTTVGPYGCISSPVPRQMFPSRKVPGYLCSDVTCHGIHSIFLQTGTTSISRASVKLDSYIQARFSEPANDHLRLVLEAQYRALAPSVIEVSSNLFDLLSDACSLEEIRAVVDHLLRQNFKSNGGHGQLSKTLGVVLGNPTQFVQSIGRSECLQLLSLHSDADISTALEKTIGDAGIQLRDYEVRRSRINRWNTPLRAELGPLGLRYVPRRANDRTARQVMRLIHAVYYETDGLDPADLAYAIQQSPTLPAGELIGIAIRERDPRDLLRSLILPVRRAAAAASTFLGISGFDSIPGDEFLNRMCWKLGMTSPVLFSELPRVSDYEDEFRDACASKLPKDELKAAGSKLFTAIEDTAHRSLVYITWALTHDHYVAARGFEYDPDMSPEILSFIEERAPASDPKFALRVDQRNTLQPLGAAFARLAKALSRLGEGSFVRPEEQIPPSAKVFAQPFSWSSSIPFFNLDPRSRSAILVALQRLSRLLQNEELIGLRNSCSHGNNELPEIDGIIRVLDLVRDWRKELWGSGIYPRMYSLTATVRDSLGRVARTYADNTDTLTLWSPEWAISPRLSSSSTILAIIPCAQMETSGPLRFTIKSRPGQDPYWAGYPKRWAVATAYSGETLNEDPEIDLAVRDSAS